MGKEANKKAKGLKKFLKDFWFLLWKDDSPKGWIFSVIFLFIFIKFIFFPGLSFVTGTVLPLAIVESCSMYHGGNLLSNQDVWWQNHEEKYQDWNIERENFDSFIFKKGFNKGDILFIVGTKPEDIQIGDVIIFTANQRNPIIHRVVEKRHENGEYVFQTIGDNNNGQLSFEKTIQENQIVGKAVFKIAPYIGWGKLIFFEFQKQSSERGFCSEN